MEKEGEREGGASGADGAVEPPLNGETSNRELSLTHTMIVYTANHLKDSVIFTSCSSL